jgi:phasin family protein
MGEDDQQRAQADAAAALQGAAKAVNTASQQVQAVACEWLEISKQAFEHASQTLEKLRAARSIEEIVAIQASYVREAFENAGNHARKFGEIMSGFPNEFTKTYQDAWLNAVNTAVQTMNTTSRTALSNVESLADTARKSAQVFERRESA